MSSSFSPSLACLDCDHLVLRRRLRRKSVQRRVVNLVLIGARHPGTTPDTGAEPTPRHNGMMPSYAEANSIKR